MKLNFWSAAALIALLIWPLFCNGQGIPFSSLQRSQDSLDMPMATQNLNGTFALEYHPPAQVVTVLHGALEIRNDSLCIVGDTCLYLFPGLTSYYHIYNTSAKRFEYGGVDDGQFYSGQYPFYPYHNRIDLTGFPLVSINEVDAEPWELEAYINKSFRVDNLLDISELNDSTQLLKIGIADAFGIDTIYHDSVPIPTGGNLTESDPIYSAWDKDYNDLTNTPTLPTQLWTENALDIYRLSNVGIGTSTPSTALHVAGSGLFTGGLTVEDNTGTGIKLGMFDANDALVSAHLGAGLSISNDTLNYVDNIDDADSDPENEGLLSFVNAGGGVYRWESNTPGSATPFLNDGNMPFDWTWNVTGNAIGINATIDYTDILNAPSPLWTESGGEIYRQSNVGVGITNPSSLFHVYGAGQHLLQVSESGTGSISSRIGNLYMRSPDNNNIFARFSVANTDEGFFSFYDGGVTGIYMRAGGDSYFVNDLAIGINSASARVHIRGLTSLSSTDALIVENSSGTSLLHVDNGGNVGIGTDAPSVALDVVGNAELTGTLTVGDLDDGGGVNILLADVNGKIVEGQLGNGLSNTGGVISSLWTSSTQGRIYRYSGESLPYVGIQTTSPTHELHVNGDIRIQGGTIIDTDNSGGSTGQYLGRDAGGIHWENISDNDNQTLGLSGNDLSISGGNTVDLSSIKPDQYVGRGYNTGTQTVSGTSKVDITAAQSTNLTVSTSLDRFTAQTGGWYTASCQCEIYATSTSGTVTINLKLNGSAPISGQYSLTHNVDHTTGKIIAYMDEIELATNDYIEFDVVNNSGSNKVIENCKLALKRI